eukprot:4363987-Heterocapsa_arctica.AAC.1
MWPAEVSVGRFGLPDDFGPSTHGHNPNLNEKYMIFDPRICEMPPAIAFRDEKFVDKKVIIDLENASHKLSKLLRHQNNRIQPFNDGG